MVCRRTEESKRRLPPAEIHRYQIQTQILDTSMTSAFNKLMGGLDEVESCFSGDGKGFEVQISA